MGEDSIYFLNCTEKSHGQVDTSRSLSCRPTCTVMIHVGLHAYRPYHVDISVGL